MKKLGLILILIFLGLVAVHFFLSPKTNEFSEPDLYDEIKARGVIKIGINPDSKPFCFLDKNWKYVGYDIDLARYISQHLINSSERIEFVPVTPSNRLLKASTGEIDIVISTVTITPQREQIVNFSIPYDVAGQAVLVKKNSSIKALTDLAGQTVGVIFGTTAEKNMKSLVPNAHLRGFKSYQDAYDALKKGEISAT